MKRHALLLATLLTSACGQNDECRRLASLERDHQELLKSLRPRAEHAAQLETQAQATEADARAQLEALGFEKTEEETNAILGQRVGAIPKASIERKTVSRDPSPDDPSPSSRTMWVVSFQEKDPDAALRHVKALLAQPPFLNLSTVIKEKGKDHWRVEMLRGAVDRVPIKPEPQPIATLESPDTIPKQMGFCGASDKRAAIARMRAEIDGLKEKASKTTVLLPTIASWRGLLGRAKLLNEKEQEVRRDVDALFEAVKKAKVELKAVGYEEPMVILEVWGGAAEKKRVETAMSPAMLGQVKSPPLDVAKPGQVRFSIAVEAAKEGGPRRAGPVPGPSIPMEALPKRKKEPTP